VSAADAADIWGAIGNDIDQVFRDFDETMANAFGSNRYRRTGKGDGDLTKVMKIKALPGEVEIDMNTGAGDGFVLTVPCSGIDWMIERLKSAREAAAIMEGDKQASKVV
jgi:hypothetical protein